MRFEIGQQVECIDGDFTAANRFWIRHLPIAGARYTISEMEAGPRGMGLRFVELSNHEIPGHFKKDGRIRIRPFVPSFLASRFRPVTNIDPLRELCHEQNQTAPVCA